MELLKQYFNDIKQLYDYQKIVIENIKAKNNTLAIIPTGGGKSLIYQLGALLLEGTTIVVSPLKALMHEQVNELKDRRINALSINSDMDFQTQRDVLRNLCELSPKLIYVSPERLNNYFFRSALKFMKSKISMVVIDEAHCISQWGFDFRPDYNKIKPFCEFLKDNGSNPVILALTATISAQPRKDIIHEFKIAQDNIFIENNVIRDNLELNFQKVEKDADKLDHIKNFIYSRQLKKVLVYTYSRQKCKELSENFDESSYFHAELTPGEKLRTYKGFKEGKIKVLFSTTAFGMGMNIPDIDGVIHYQLPESIEEYYQHVGRGARDKKKCSKCYCLFLWSEKNFEVKADRIRKNTIKESNIDEAFDWINPKRKVISKEMNFEEVMRNDGSWGTNNLRLLIPTFEKFGVLDMLGEVNGRPKSIVFKSNTSFWENVINSLDGIRNSYTTVEKKLGYRIQDMIDHIYEQELNGNIKKMPATERLLFLSINHSDLPDGIKQNIIDESLRIERNKIASLDKLRELCDVKDKEKFIAEQLGVPYNKGIV
ncbi:MAG: RecQ family ATP-dependent DNA helicase [Lutispora sp.]|nr:RecQ family ATP-dependent DNA helicase [Lutispora sp.]